jgi:hypothetical protein
MAEVARCPIEGCERPVQRREWCNAHYRRWLAHGDPSDNWSNGNQSDFKRRRALMAKIRVEPSGCWIWTGNKIAGGYGTMRVGGKRREYVHRVSYRLHKGPIPDGYHLDHLCRQRLCVNPEHLEAVLPRVNILRGVGATAQHARKTHCPRGHEYTPENTITPAGRRGRRCRTCSRAYEKARWQARAKPHEPHGAPRV